MRIQKNKAVHFHYKLMDDGGDILERSKQGEPLSYIHGSGGIIPGLEKAMEGKPEGERFEISIPPEEAYGFYRPELLKDIAQEQFQEEDAVKVGARFQVTMDDHVHVATVVEIEDGVVTLDLNHPLADKILSFEVEIVSVRDATSEELSHGHVQGDDGNHH